MTKTRTPEAIAARANRSIRGAIRDLQELIKESQEHLSEAMRKSVPEADEEQIKAFIGQPWCVLTHGPSEYLVIVPRWTGIQAGWLKQQTDTYNLFLVDKYTRHFGGIPDEMLPDVPMPEAPEAFVAGQKLKAEKETAEKVRKHIKPTSLDNVWTVRKGHEFELLAELIELGCLPFQKKPVKKEDLRPWAFQGPLAELRDYQVDAWRNFLQTGAVCVTWPTGAGKSVLGLYPLGRLKGRKLVVVGSRTTLKDQWRRRIEGWVGKDALDEVDLITYQARHKIKEKYVLVIFDECHALPADSFSRLATVPAKYRIGLSASPYREDDRTNFVLALTGWPVGADWREFYRAGVVRPPDVTVRIVVKDSEKESLAAQEARDADGRCLIFCDSIDRGRRMAQRLGCPHVHGETKDRMETIESSDVSVISRVGDEGISLPDLAKVIELEFHGGSRRQSLQRVGRLFHAKNPGRHVLLMTRDEHRKFGRRILALEEKGVIVKVQDEQ